MSTEHFDVIVVGAGSGGGVLAPRLTDDPSRRVLLLEAGPDFPTELELQPGFYSGGHQFQHQYVGDHDWGYWSEPLPAHNGSRRIRLPRGKMVGGSSMANAQMLVRAAPHDFEPPSFGARGRLLVEKHGDLEFFPYPLAQPPRHLHAFVHRNVLNRNERHHVHHTEARVNSFVVIQREPFHHESGQQARCLLADQREHTAVVVGIGVDVQQDFPKVLEHAAALLGHAPTAPVRKAKKAA